MMPGILLILAWLTPLLLAAAVVLSPRLTWKAMIFAGVPGLAAAIMVPAGSMIEVPGLLLGTRFGLDQVGAGFLWFTALIWNCAGWHATGYVSARRKTFSVHFLLAMSGNFGLVLAQDLVGFYFFFALMSFASYALVIHDRSASARYAGTVYIVLVVIGEVLIFSGMAGVATLAGTTSLSEIGADWLRQPGGVVFFGALLLGFGIKAGALPLHVWLPLAHPAAPTPASAVLSGAMIKAGLLGWLRFLPLGEAVLPGWGALCVGLGALAFTGAALYGCLQSNSKALLAYSSISKMGLLTMAFGVVLTEPGSKSVVIPCILAYATHHCLCKGALFLSVSIDRTQVSPGVRRWLTTLLLLLPPLSLAGFALTGGAVAKTVIKAGLSAAISPPAQSGLTALLLLNGVVTAILMTRFCWQRFTNVPQPHHQLGRASYFAWAVLVGLVMVTPLLLMRLYPELAFGRAFSPAGWWSSVWPVLLGAGCGAVLISYPRLRRVQWPPGDLLLLYRHLPGLPGWLHKISRGVTALRPVSVAKEGLLPSASRSSWSNILRRAEYRLGQAAVFGLMFIGLLTFSTFLLYSRL